MSFIKLNLIIIDLFPSSRGLRIDTMSQILSYANVHHGTNVLLSETCAGLVLGAILERQGHLTGAFYIFC